MWQALILLLLSTITVLLWLSYEMASAFSLFGSSAIPDVLHFAAAAATAGLCVIVVAQLILRLGFATYMQVEPTGLQRGLVFSALIFAAAAGVLAHLGLDISTILTTSALLTAIVGLSIQPSLVSLMAGLTIDRALRVGDGLLINDQVVEITALSWRTVVGQRPDGGRIILPNSRLADNTIEVLPRTQPAQVEAVIKIKAAIPPHEVSEIVDQILADMDAVDLTRPEIVTAMDADITGRRAQYRITFWVRHYSQRDTAEGNFRRRAWYAFRRQSSAERADTAHSKQDEAAVARALEQALRTAKSVQGDSEVSAAAIKSLVEAGEILSYGDGERIILPERLADHLYVLVSGTLAEALPFVEAQVSSVSNAKQPISAAPTTRQGWLDRIQRSLALRIGPYAEHATRIAAGNAASIAEVCATVAMEIEDPAKREAFVSEVNAPSERIHQPGLLFRSNRDRVRRLWSDPPLRAVDHAEIIAVPSALLERHLPAGKKAARVN